MRFFIISTAQGIPSTLRSKRGEDVPPGQEEGLPSWASSARIACGDWPDGEALERRSSAHQPSRIEQLSPVDDTSCRSSAGSIGRARGVEPEVHALDHGGAPLMS